MKLSFLPLLRIQRDLYALPRMPKRAIWPALGYPPQGLTERAGLALALHDARASLTST